MSRQADLFDRASKCQLASQAAADEEQRLVFRHLRDLWTNLANESPGMTDARLAKEVAAIEEIHDAGFGSNKAAE